MDYWTKVLHNSAELKRILFYVFFRYDFFRNENALFPQNWKRTNFKTSGSESLIIEKNASRGIINIVSGIR